MDQEKDQQIMKERGEIAVLEEAINFVEKNIVPVKDGRKCVDGRYFPDTDDRGRIARPGADFGYVEALLSINHQQDLGLTVEQCFDVVYEAVTESDQQFYMHTDEHANHGHGIIGCGHLAKATEPELAKDYGVLSEQMVQVIQYAGNRQEEGARIVNVVLEGEHKEKGVLVVTEKDYSVNSRDDQTMYFVYDKDRDEEFMKSLVAKMKIPNLTVEVFKAASNKQLQATLHNLAFEKPMFQVNKEQAKPRVVLTGKVQ